MRASKIVLITLISFAVLIFGTFIIAYSTGMLDATLTRTVGKEKANANREVFKSTDTYVEGKIDDLSKYRLEMKKTDDKVAKAAIAEHINSEFANFDRSLIEEEDLRDFLDDCMDGKYVISQEE